MGYIHPAVSEICDPQNLDPICGKFDKFLAHGQAHIGQMGKWPWQCTTRGLDNSTKLRMEKIRQAVTEIWVPQVWQPPARPPAHPDRDDNTTIPLQPWAEGWGVKMCFRLGSFTEWWWQTTKCHCEKKSILWELIYWKTVATPQLSKSRCVGPQNLEATLEVEPCLDSSGLYPGMSEGLGVSLKY